MDRFTVDRNKCMRDGLCAAVCPMRIIHDTDTGIPSQETGLASQCIDCGHCVAICPAGALSLGAMNADSCVPLGGGWRINPDIFDRFARGRRSIRNFKPDLIDRSIIARMISIAGYAPTAKNRQPIEWLVIQGKDKIHGIAGEVIAFMRIAIEKKLPAAHSLGMSALVEAWDRGEDRICRGAPSLIIAHAKKDDPHAQMSAANALAYLELAAAAFGAGTCWSGFLYAAATMYPQLNNVIGLPDGHGCFGGVMAGYPEYEFARIPDRKKPRIIWL
jgi:nitroreductase/NAD-dependent dihydropyrimidine dehydrogenase PreA subunit